PPLPRRPVRPVGRRGRPLRPRRPRGPRGGRGSRPRRGTHPRRGPHRRSRGGCRSADGPGRRPRLPGRAAGSARRHGPTRPRARAPARPRGRDARLAGAGPPHGGGAMTTQRVVLTVEEYLDELLTDLLPGAGPVPGTEEVGLTDSLGRVLAAPVHAAGDVPAFANSAMDGYAVRQVDLDALPATLQVVGDVPAGSGADPALGPGQCVRIM